MKIGTTTSALALLCALAVPVDALAGPIARSGRAIANKQRGGGGSSGGGARTVGDGRRCTTCAADVTATGVTATGVTATTAAAARPGAALAGPPHLELFLGGHAPVGSNAAFVGDVRGAIGGLGLAVTGARYLEHIENKMDAQTVSLDLVTVSMTGRAVRADATELWVEVGVGVTDSNLYAPMFGGQAGLRAEHAISPQLAIMARGRYIGFDEGDVSAIELGGSVRAGVIAVGYRSLKFNVGPPIHGPDVGVAVGF